MTTMDGVLSPIQVLFQLREVRRKKCGAPASRSVLQELLAPFRPVPVPEVAEVAVEVPAAPAAPAAETPAPAAPPPAEVPAPAVERAAVEPPEHRPPSPAALFLVEKASIPVPEQGHAPPMSLFACDRFRVKMTRDCCANRQYARTGFDTPVHPACAAKKAPDGTFQATCPQGAQVLVQLGVGHPEGFTPKEYSWFREDYKAQKKAMWRAKGKGTFP